MDREDKLRTLERVIDWVKTCDTKVSYVMTLQGVLLTIIFTSEFIYDIGDTFTRKVNISFDQNSITAFVECIFLYATLLLIFTSLIHAYFSLTIRIDNKIHKQDSLLIESILFFGSIQKYSYKDYKKRVQELTKEDFEEELDSQIYINSKVCYSKFYHYQKNIQYFAISIVLAIGYIIFRNINLFNNSL